MVPKRGKPTDHDPNVISSIGSQNTSTCQIWDHSSLVFTRKHPEIANLDCFTKSSCCQNEENQQMMNKIKSFLKVVRIHQKFQSIQSNCNKNSGEESSLSLMPPQTLSEKLQLKKKMAKNTKLQFWPNPEIMLSKSCRGIIMENWKLLQ